MKRTAEQLYEYETKRIDKYTNDFYNTLDTLNIEQQDYDKLCKLFMWYGHARAIKSKAYQDMKANKKLQ